jgi:hypothetical protein
MLILLTKDRWSEPHGFRRRYPKNKEPFRCKTSELLVLGTWGIVAYAWEKPTVPGECSFVPLRVSLIARFACDLAGNFMFACMPYSIQMDRAQIITLSAVYFAVSPGTWIALRRGRGRERRVEEPPLCRLVNMSQQ